MLTSRGDEHIFDSSQLTWGNVLLFWHLANMHLVSVLLTGMSNNHVTPQNERDEHAGRRSAGKVCLASPAVVEGIKGAVVKMWLYSAGVHVIAGQQYRMSWTQCVASPGHVQSPPDPLAMQGSRRDHLVQTKCWLRGLSPFWASAGMTVRYTCGQAESGQAWLAPAPCPGSTLRPHAAPACACMPFGRLRLPSAWATLPEHALSAAQQANQGQKPATRAPRNGLVLVNTTGRETQHHKDRLAGDGRAQQLSSCAACALLHACSSLPHVSSPAVVHLLACRLLSRHLCLLGSKNAGR